MNQLPPPPLLPDAFANTRLRKVAKRIARVERLLLNALVGGNTRGRP